MKNILVAGAGKGIGLALVNNLQRDSQNNIWAITRSESGSLLETGVNIQYADIALDAEAVSSLHLPDVLDGLVYCPGSINLKPFQRLTTVDFVNDFTQNVAGAVQLLHKCIPHLKKSSGASVVLFSTVAVKTGMAFHSSIAASKGAVEGLVRSLAAEYAATKIRFNAIAPSLVETALSAPLLSTDEKREALNKRHPLQRIGNAQEIASLVSFLLSDNASWITGQVIGVDGGMGSLK